MTVKICAVALLAAILSALLSGMGFKSRGLFATLCALIILGTATSLCDGVVGELMSFAEQSGITDAARTALRALGLGYVFGITADVCTDLGEGGIASAIVAVGRIQIFLVAFPYFSRIISLGVELIK